MNLSRDHKPSEKDEYQRIISSNGIVEPIKNDKGQFVGPPRVWKKNEKFPGLGMSRSFGDKIGMEVGITANPEIIEWNLSKDDKFILIASDGIWEYLNVEDVRIF